MEEERLAKEQEENLTKLRSQIGSGATTAVSEERPQTQSSGITEFDESDSQAEASRPQTRSESRPLSGDHTVTIDEIQKYSAGTFLDEKQRYAFTYSIFMYEFTFLCILVGYATTNIFARVRLR